MLFLESGLGMAISFPLLVFNFAGDMPWRCKVRLASREANAVFRGDRDSVGKYTLGKGVRRLCSLG